MFVCQILDKNSDLYKNELNTLAGEEKLIKSFLDVVRDKKPHRILKLIIE
jgi:hypothetical protein